MKNVQAARIMAAALTVLAAGVACTKYRYVPSDADTDAIDIVSPAGGGAGGNEGVGMDGSSDMASTGGVSEIGGLDGGIDASMTLDTAPPPPLALLRVSDRLINLGPIEVGVTTPTSVRISNVGQAALARVPTVTSSAPTELVISSNGCMTALNVNGYCDIAFGFNPAAGNMRSQTLTVSDGTTSATVTVTAMGNRRLTVATVGGGTGTVTSIPAGIQCGTTCSFLAGQDGTIVTLHAQTANSLSSLFTGWSGGGCSGLVRDCTVTVLATTTVTATFTPLTANLIFATSAKVAANVGSAAAYDGICNSAATAAGINNAASDAYTALMSDAATTAISRLGPSANGWLRMDGEPFADSQTTLFGASKMFNTVQFDDLGEAVSGSGSFILNGVGNGTSIPTTCNNWTSNSAALTAAAAIMNAGPFDWLSFGQYSCSILTPIICMGHTRNVTVSPHVTTGRKLWINNGFVRIVAGQSLDALCQASRPAGVTTAVALVAHPNTTASSLLDPTKAYVRVDGTLIGTGMQLQTNNDLPSGIWQQGDGQYIAPVVWTGAPAIQTAGTMASTCGDWVDSTNPNLPYTGNATWPGGWWTWAAASCQDTTTGLYCVQIAP